MRKTELLELLQVGKTLRIDFGKDNPNNEVIHIRAIVDDDQVVFKTWNKHRQRWSYCVKWMYYFELLLEDGHLTNA